MPKKILNDYYRDRHSDILSPAFAVGTTIIITIMFFLIGR